MIFWYGGVVRFDPVVHIIVCWSGRLGRLLFTRRRAKTVACCGSCQFRYKISLILASKVAAVHQDTASRYPLLPLHWLRTTYFTPTSYCQTFTFAMDSTSTPLQFNGTTNTATGVQHQDQAGISAGERR